MDSLHDCILENDYWWKMLDFTRLELFLSRLIMCPLSRQMTVPVVPVKPALQDTMHPEWSTPVVATNIFKGSVCGYQHRNTVWDWDGINHRYWSNFNVLLVRSLSNCRGRHKKIKCFFWSFSERARPPCRF